MEPQTPRYRPIKVQDTSELDGLGRAVRAKRVDYQLADGTQSYVTIPFDQYNADTLRALLEAEAGRHEAVMRVRGDTVYPSDMSHNPWERNVG